MYKHDLVYLTEDASHDAVIELINEEAFGPGDCVGFKGGVRNGHHFQNRSDRDAVLLTIGTRDDADHGEYTDIDMVFTPVGYGGSGRYQHKDGTPY